jgi:pSer/pThr/pTyr-binding forkhead associated (FHA) protein
MAKALLKYKGAVVKEVIIDRDVITIGRKPDNDIVIDNQAVSGHHAKILLNNNIITIVDLSSLNGTYLSGQPISQSELYDGDSITIGVHTLDIYSDKKRDADKKVFAVQGRSMEETMIITSSDKKKPLSPSDKGPQDALGGFVVVEGAADKKEYEFRERVSMIGSQEGSLIVLKGFFAPKIAALVNRRKEGYFITPSGGTKLKVNGKEIEQRYDLKDGDIVDVSTLKLQFYLKD